MTQGQVQLSRSEFADAVERVVKNSVASYEGCDALFALTSQTPLAGAEWQIDPPSTFAPELVTDSVRLLAGVTAVSPPSDPAWDGVRMHLRELRYCRDWSDTEYHLRQVDLQAHRATGTDTPGNAATDLLPQAATGSAEEGFADCGIGLAASAVRIWAKRALSGGAKAGEALKAMARPPLWPSVEQMLRLAGTADSGLVRSVHELAEPFAGAVGLGCSADVVALWGRPISTCNHSAAVLKRVAVGPRRVARAHGGDVVTAICRHGDQVVTAAGDGSIHFWAVGSSASHEARRALAFPGAHAGGVTALVSTARGLWSAGRDSFGRRWSTPEPSAAVQDGRTDRRWRATAGPDPATGAMCLLLRSEGLAVAAVEVRYDAGQQSLSLTEHDGKTSTLYLPASQGDRETALHALATLAASCSCRNNLPDPLQVRPNLVLDGHDGAVLSMCAVGSDLMCTGGRDRTVRVWEQSTGRCVRVCQGSAGPVFAVCPFRGGVAAGSDCGSVWLWNHRSGVAVEAIPHSAGRTWVRGLCAAGDVLVSAHDDGAVVRWEAVDAPPSDEDDTFALPQLMALQDGPSDLDVPASRAGVRCRPCDGLPSAAAGSEMRTTEGCKCSGPALCVSSLSTLVAAGCGGGTTSVWDARSGKALCDLAGHTGWVTSVAGGPGGLLVTGGADGDVVLWGNVAAAGGGQS
eukprot:TRINITY_DN20654_c0_g1_i1.p1 TRINITY_DN20654_c0_g1~~TRINITY_DN20654_c0_g1_i1.p1  ORF type:complete len:708 (+),score=194.80 TRINITY_DN20654_c0_g1_i1:63-2126(+)